jgi:periodic tryptophan protein 1
MLPAFPLCLEWLDFPPAGSSSPADQNAAPSSSNPAKTHGNYIAVGTFDPEIEIWSLDTIDGLYPDALLGRPDKTSAHVPVPMGTGKKKSKLVKPREVNADHHVDAVLGLSWNTQHRSLLASASADKTVKLWDLSRGGEEGSKAVRSFGLHEDKVQAVEWCKASGQGSVLLTGSYDRTVRTWDSRSPAAGVGAYVGADVEGVRWDPFDPYGFYVSLPFRSLLSPFDLA